MNVRTILPPEPHEKLRTAMLAMIGAEFSDVPSEEVLAIACQIVGGMIACQDQRRFTKAAIMQIVSLNIEAGNRGVVESLMAETAGRA